MTIVAQRNVERSEMDNYMPYLKYNGIKARVSER